MMRRYWPTFFDYKTAFFSTGNLTALLSAHHVGPAVWGRLRVRAGRVLFAFEDDPMHVVGLSAGEQVDIPPLREHHVEALAGARFVVDFYRMPRD